MGHLLYIIENNGIVLFIMFCPLAGHPGGHFIAFLFPFEGHQRGTLTVFYLGASKRALLLHAK